MESDLGTGLNATCGYSCTIVDAESRKRYADKVQVINGIDPYELERSEWQDDNQPSASNYATSSLPVSDFVSQPLNEGRSTFFSFRCRALS